MRTTALILLQLLCISTTSLFAQGTIKVTVTGITGEVEKRILDHDLIPYGFGLSNVTLRLKNTDQKNWTLYSGHIYDVKYDPATRHYNMNITWEVKPSKWYSLTKPVIIRVIAHTKFNNAIWAEVKVEPSKISDPIVLDQYSAVEGSTDKPAVKGFLVTGKEFQPFLTSKFLPGDAVIQNGKNVLIRVKNQGQAEWAQENEFSYGASTGRIWSKIALKDKIDITKPIVLQVALKTNFGNYIWGEKIKNLENFHEDEIWFKEYTGKAGDPNAVLNKTAGQEPVANVTQTGSEVPALIPAFASSSNTAGAKGITLKQHGGSIVVANAPDSMIDTNLKSQLLQSTRIVVGFQEISIKGNKPIEYNPGQGYVLMAWSDGDQLIRTDHGMVKVKNETPVYFSKFRITGIKLAENALLKTEYGELAFGADPYYESAKPDIRFEEAGKLQEGTIAREMNFNAAGTTLTLPNGSRLRFRNKKITEIAISQNLELKLANKTFTIKSRKDEPSVWLDSKTGAIEEFVVADGNLCDVDGVSIPVKADSKVTVKNEQGIYIIHRFYAGQPMTLKEHARKGKVKEVQVKEGKRLTVEDDRITKIN